MQQITFNNLHPPIQRKILMEAQNLDIRLVNKSFCRLFDKALEEKWNFILNDANDKEKYNILNTIEIKCNGSTGFEKFKKLFIDITKRTNFEKVCICQSYEELIMIEGIKGHDELLLKVLREGYFGLNSYTKYNLNISPEMTAGEARKKLRESKKELEKIRYIALKELNLNSLPFEIIYFLNVEDIELCWNHFTDIPLILFKLRHLREINFCGNNFTTIDGQSIQRLSGLKNLQKLYFHYCSIDYADDVLKKLSINLGLPYESIELRDQTGVAKELKFSVDFDAKWGNHLEIRGVWQSPRLEEQEGKGPCGMTWEKGIPLVCRGKDLWELRLDTQSFMGMEIEFKIVKVDQNGKVTWEEYPVNRTTEIFCGLKKESLIITPNIPS